MEKEKKSSLLDNIFSLSLLMLPGLLSGFLCFAIIDEIMFRIVRRFEMWNGHWFYTDIVPSFLASLASGFVVALVLYASNNEDRLRSRPPEFGTAYKLCGIGLSIVFFTFILWMMFRDGVQVNFFNVNLIWVGAALAYLCFVTYYIVRDRIAKSRSK